MKDQTMTEIRKRVDRGIEFMNHNYGTSWLKKIDPKQLDIADPNSCVLGQVEGEYYEATFRLNLDSITAAGLGFAAWRQANFSLHESVMLVQKEWSRLTRTWKQNIKRLQKLQKIKAPVREP